MGATTGNKRLVKNTLMLYLRTFVVMIVSLYTVRVIFDVLGINDYGIQNVVSGFVSMFSFVTGSLSVAISRFMSLELGRNNENRISAIFSNAIYIMIAFSVILVVVIEIVGIPFLNYKMNIAPDRIIAANWVLQFSIISLFLNMLCVPFDALIISYEKLYAYAYISIVDVVLKLLMAYLICVSPVDKLISYAFLLFIQSLIIRIIYSAYCKYAIGYCDVKGKIDKPLVKEILSITGWDFFGSASNLLKNSGVNIILNIYCGPAVNASRAIAMQINAAVTKFSGGFLTALRPQITKSYAASDRSHFIALVNQGTRFSSYLLLFISLPLIVECHYVIDFWLGEVPQHCVNFVTLIIILSISEGTLIYSHNAALLATGKIRNCQIITGFLQIANLPLSYLALKLGASPEFTVFIAIVVAQISCFIRVAILKKLIGYSIFAFVTEIYLKIIVVSILSVIPPLILRYYMDESFLRFICVISLCCVSTSLAIAYVGCNATERTFIISKIRKIVVRK